MRTRDTQQKAFMDSATYGQQSVWLKVEIDRDGSGSTYVDVSDYNGRDYVRGFTYREALDAPAWSGELQLAAWLGDSPSPSLSPGMASSFLNTGGVLCKPYNRVRIHTAIVPKGSGYISIHQRKVFEGRIVKWKQDGANLNLSCVDLLTGDLMRRVLEVEQDYGATDPGSSTASDIQEIIQNILDDHINTTISISRTQPLSARATFGVPYHLHSATGTSTNPWQAADDTNATIWRYTQSRMTVWDAIASNAASIAWQLRVRWHNAASINDFRLVLEPPERSTPTTVATIDPVNTQARITGTELGLDGIRNRVRIGYEWVAGVRSSYFTNDAASEATYGPLYMEVNVGASSQVNEPPEAQRMGDAILLDVADPIIVLSCSMPYHWAWQLNDYVDVLPDNIHIDSTQSLAVVSRTNTLTQGGAGSTMLTLRGKPSSQVVAHIAAQRDPKPKQRGLIVKYTAGTTMHTNGNFTDFSGE